MKARDIRILGVRANHPGRGEPSYISLDVALSYLRGEPVEHVRLSVDETADLIAQAATALRVMVRDPRP